jgi:hypothetical protein
VDRLHDAHPNARHHLPRVGVSTDQDQKSPKPSHHGTEHCVCYHKQKCTERKSSLEYVVTPLELHGIKCHGKLNTVMKTALSKELQHMKICTYPPIRVAYLTTLSVSQTKELRMVARSTASELKAHGTKRSLPNCISQQELMKTTKNCQHRRHPPPPPARGTSATRPAARFGEKMRRETASDGENIVAHGYFGHISLWCLNLNYLRRNLN